MKTFREIQKSCEKGDYTRVAELVCISPSTVRMVVAGHRYDHHNIQKTFSDLLENRERLAAREEKRRERKAARESKLQAA
jgi:hypothetical protein